MVQVRASASNQITSSCNSERLVDIFRYSSGEDHASDAALPYHIVQLDPGENAWRRSVLESKSRHYQ
jgi:hypothetical protein